VVDVVNLSSKRCAQDGTMHEDSVWPKAIPLSSAATGIPSPSHRPAVGKHALRVGGINDCEQTTRQRNEDRLIGHGDLQSLCRAGGTDTAARHPFDSPNFSMVA
jgi:hypothetical protein